MGVKAMTSEIFVLDNVRIKDDEVLRILRIEKDGEDEDRERALELRDEVCALARPKYMLGDAKLTASGPDWVELDGKRFRSPLLAEKLPSAGRICPYLATCGTEAMEWADALADEIEQFWANSLMFLLLGRASAELRNRAAERFDGRKYDRLAPGMHPEWTLLGQRELFDYIGQETLGIVLADTCLMLPQNSISGIFAG